MSSLISPRSLFRFLCNQFQTQVTSLQGSLSFFCPLEFLLSCSPGCAVQLQPLASLASAETITYSGKEENLQIRSPNRGRACGPFISKHGSHCIAAKKARQGLDMLDPGSGSCCSGQPTPSSDYAASPHDRLCKVEVTVTRGL